MLSFVSPGLINCCGRFTNSLLRNTRGESASACSPQHPDEWNLLPLKRLTVSHVDSSNCTIRAQYSSICLGPGRSSVSVDGFAIGTSVESADPGYPLRRHSLPPSSQMLVNGLIRITIRVRDVYISVSAVGPYRAATMTNREVLAFEAIAIFHKAHRLSMMCCRALLVKISAILSVKILPTTTRDSSSPSNHTGIHCR